LYAGGLLASRSFDSTCTSFYSNLVPNVPFFTRWGCSLLLCKIVSNSHFSKDDRPVQETHNRTLAPVCSPHSENLLANGMQVVSCTCRQIGHLGRTHVNRGTICKHWLGANAEGGPVKKAAASNGHTCMRVLTSDHCGQPLR
jgi:hypothetical protein